MSEFSKLTLTKKGAELLASAVGEESITFTKFALGDGDYALDFSNATQLVSKKQDVPISDSTRDKDTLKIKGVLEIGNVTESFYWKELGIYARGTDGVEILYMYANAGSKYSFIGTSGFDEKIIEVVLKVGSATNVNVTIDPTNIDKHNVDPTAHKKMYDRTSNRLPGADDDSVRGYTVGSLWYFSGTLYCCEDNTQGKAVWKEYGGSGILSTINKSIETAKKEAKAYTDEKVKDASLLTTGKVSHTVLNIATGAQAEAGLDDTTIMTPKKVYQSIKANASGGSGDINMFAKSSNDHKFTAETDTTTFTLSSAVFDEATDLVVFSYEGVEMSEGESYTMNGLTVTLDFTLKAGESIEFTVFHMSYSYRDLKDTPDVGDTALLETASKEVVGAINEINSNVIENTNKINIFLANNKIKTITSLEDIGLLDSSFSTSDYTTNIHNLNMAIKASSIVYLPLSSTSNPNLHNSLKQKMLDDLGINTTSAFMLKIEKFFNDNDPICFEIFYETTSNDLGQKRFFFMVNRNGSTTSINYKARELATTEKIDISSYFNGWTPSDSVNDVVTVCKVGNLVSITGSVGNNTQIPANPSKIFEVPINCRPNMVRRFAVDTFKEFVFNKVAIDIATDGSVIAYPNQQIPALTTIRFNISYSVN